MRDSSVRYLFIAFILLCLSQVAEAQNLSRLRVKTLAVADTMQLDSLNIVPESLLIFTADGKARIADTDYDVNDIKGELTWKQKPVADSIKVNYRTYPFNFTAARFNKDPARVLAQNNTEENPFSYIPSTSVGGVIDFGTLDYNGSFARGVSFGNNQDVVLNSSFNLQLSGKITEDIEVVAALTDNNIPIQPDGNTQQIQEFDQVFIQLKMKNHQLTVGDYEIRNLSDHYFMRFYKRLQGGSYTGNFDFGEKGKLQSSTSLAIAKGKFTRNMLTAQEGNQGPYKLTGPNGETFIIVLAGTERVYINGELLKRGANFDYVIDYNLGEITFMPNVLITRDLRIAVEFEYSERNYFRSLMYLDNKYQLNDKLNLRFNFFTEQDNKNQPSQIDLTAEQKAVLQNVGDNLDDAVYPGYQLAEYDPNRIMYRDSILPGLNGDTIFIFSTDPDSADYRLNFTYVGPGSGNYTPAQTVANGRVFRWVPPVNGVPQGTYEPVIVLITPKREQLMTLGMDWKPSKNDNISTEIALSNDDQNTFSEQGNGDNAGMATHLNYTRRYTIKDTTNLQTYFTTELDYEFTQKNFNALERYRPVEFVRNWNLTNFSGDNDQHLVSAGLNFIKTDMGNASYQFSTFQVGEEYSGYQQSLTSDLQKKGYKLKVFVRYLTSESLTQNSKFFRPRIEASKSFAKLKGWTIGSRYEQEINKIRDDSTNTLLSSSFVFNDWRVYIHTADTAKVKTKVEYIRRLEFFTDSLNRLDLTNLSNTYNFNGAWESNAVNQLRWQFSYRQFQNQDSVKLTGNKFQQFYLGRVEYGLNLFKGGVTSNILYELGSGSEQRRSFTYLQVADGQGIYMWTDRNENGIQDLNEFDIAPAGFEDQANFIRVSNPTNEFDPVNTTTYNQVFSLNPRVAWYKKKGVRGFVARFSTITSLQLNRKVFRSSDLSPFNPFILNTNDEALVTLNTLIRNSIFFNRSSSKYSLEYTYQDNDNKVNLVSGFEVRSLTDHTFRVRWNMIKQLNLDLKYKFGIRANDAELFDDRVYSIDFNEINPKVTYLPNTKFRVSTEYEFALRQNTIGDDNETAVSHEIRTEARYSVVSKSTLNFEFTFANIAYDGSANTSLEFAMLEGFQDGNNYTWRASYDRSLAKNVQLNLIYEGRKTGDANMVHIGRAQVRAIF